MTYHLIRNNLRKKELVVIESKQKLLSFVLPNPHSIFVLLTLFILKKSVYKLQYYVSECFVMLKIYVLGFCDQILLQIVNIMHVCMFALLHRYF